MDTRNLTNRRCALKLEIDEVHKEAMRLYRDSSLNEKDVDAVRHIRSGCFEMLVVLERYG